VRTIHALPIVLILALTACHPGGSGDPGAAREDLDRNLEPREVRLVTAEAREEKPAVSLVGEIRAFDAVTVSSEVAGRVEKVLVEVGDRVESGQALVEVDREVFHLRQLQAEASLSAARAELELAERDLERKLDLLSDKTIPQASFDQAKAGHDLAVANVAAAEAAVGLARRDFASSIVRAPAAGAITARTVVGGQWADVGQGMLRIALGAKVKVVARVPSHWVPYLQGLDFSIRPGEPTRRARLYSIDPVVNEASRSFEVVGTAPADGLRPGLFANITLTSPETRMSLWLPVSAVMTSDTPRVMLAADGVIELRRVQTDRRDDGMVEVVSGLDEGEEVILDVSGLTRGLPVKVVG